MLTKRIIPCLDVDGGRVVKGVNFTTLRDAGDPISMGKLYYNQGADELVFLDITATCNNRNAMVDVVRDVAKNIYIPFTVGGGIRTLHDMRSMLRAGADKVSLNTAAFVNPRLIQVGANTFGNQCVVLAIDAKRSGSGWEVYINGGRTSTSKDVVTWAKEGVMRGAGEILLTSMDRDGTKKGFDIELTKAVSESINVPVIASGGAGNLQDFYDVFSTGRADAALGASLFHFREMKIQILKEYLEKNKVPVRSNNI